MNEWLDARGFGVCRGGGRVHTHRVHTRTHAAVRRTSCCATVMCNRIRKELGGCTLVWSALVRKGCPGGGVPAAGGDLLLRTPWLEPVAHARVGAAAHPAASDMLVTLANLGSIDRRAASFPGLDRCAPPRGERFRCSGSRGESARRGRRDGEGEGSHVADTRGNGSGGGGLARSCESSSTTGVGLGDEVPRRPRRPRPRQACVRPSPLSDNSHVEGVTRRYAHAAQAAGTLETQSRGTGTARQPHDTRGLAARRTAFVSARASVHAVSAGSWVIGRASPAVPCREEREA
jgi:hypothetical protein